MRQMAERPSAPPNESLKELRDRIDQAMAQIPTAPGVEVTETRWGDVGGLRCRPVDVTDPPTLVYFHGGGFRMGSSIAYQAFTSHLALELSAEVVVPDYRLAPEHPYPAALHDVVEVWNTLLADGHSPDRIVIAGDSAGGGLAASLVLTTTNRAVPAGLVCLSPWVDLQMSSDTYRLNRDSDRLFSRESADAAARLYLGTVDPADPLVSPVVGDWTSAPPALILVGGAEVLLGDSLDLARTMAVQGVDVELRVFAEMPHIWMTNHPAFPEAIRAIEAVAGFFGRVTS